MSDLQLPERLNAAEVLVDSHLARGRADKTVILCGDRTISYRQLFQSVNRFGNVLLELGVRREERVSFLLPDSPQWAYTFFGTIKMGAVAVPINTWLTSKEYEYLLNDSRARVLVLHADLLDHIGPIRHRLEHLEHVITVGAKLAWELDFDALMQAALPSLDPADTSKDDTAFWLYSSGTTGRPKGAIHLHHDMLVAADAFAKDTLGLREDDVSFSVAKLFFAYGLGNGLHIPLRTGGTTVLLPDRPLPDKIFAIIDRYQPTVFYGVPTSYAALLHAAEKAGRTDFGRVRLCVSAGETLPRYLFQQWRDRFGLEILDGIGSTEITHTCISNRPGQARPGSTGQIVPGFEAKIVDDDGVELPPGHVGTLMIKGDSIAQGYWNQHEATKRTFCGEWINTHDQFMVDQEGFFWYSGRSDDMLKVSGQAVWPAEVEGLLQEHPAVLESGVAGAATEDGLIKPVAFVVLKEGHQASADLADELKAFVRTNASPHKYPRAVIFVDSLPKTATGKIKRYELRQRAAVDGVLRNGQMP